MTLEALAGDIRDLLERIAVALEALADRPEDPPADPRRRLLTAIAEVVGSDVPFSAVEVIEHAALDADLDLALTTCNAATAGRLGCALRAARDRPVGGWILRRDGDAWRIDRT